MADWRDVRLEIYPDETEHSKRMCMLIAVKKSQWLDKEMQILLKSLQEYGIYKPELEIYYKLIEEQLKLQIATQGQETPEILIFGSLNELYEQLYTKFLSKWKRDFKWLKSVDRKKFFGVNKIFYKMLQAGLLIERKTKAKKHNYRREYILGFPKYSSELRYEKRNEIEFLSGRETHWQIDDLENHLYRYLKDKKVRPAYKELPKDLDMNLDSYLFFLRQKLEEPSMELIYEVFKENMRRKKLIAEEKSKIKPKVKEDPRNKDIEEYFAQKNDLV